MTYEQREPGRYVWRIGRLTSEVIVIVDGCVAIAAFLDGELLRVWDEPTGEA